MNNELQALAPCPFCGSPALLEQLGDHHGAYYNLGCSVRGCLAHHAIYTESPDECSIEESVAAWNRRADTGKSADAGDAARYRWLKKHAGNRVDLQIDADCLETSESLDASIDAVISAGRAAPESGKPLPGEDLNWQLREGDQFAGGKP